jgi:ATP-binding cassette, subfamily B (MDR/TAP), member 1
MLNLIATITTAIILSCIIGWKLALVCASTIPILLLCGFLRFWVLSRFEARAGKAYLKSATIACEAVSAVSTIASLTREEDVWNSYHGRLKEQLSKSIRSILKTSLLYAAAQSFALLCMGLGFWYGGRLILAREYSMFQFFVCFSSVIFSAQSAGALFSFAPDMAKVDRPLSSLRIFVIEFLQLIRGHKVETRSRISKVKSSSEMYISRIHRAGCKSYKA